MKAGLSVLLCFAFLHAQALALSGGPRFPVGQNLVGTYGGVLVIEEGSSDSRATSIGLFSLAVKDAGLARGAIVVFVEGTAFNGNITAVADPRDGSLKGVIDAISTFIVLTPGGSASDNRRVFAQGNIDATVVPSSSRFFNSVDSLIGTAQLDIFGSLDTDLTPLVTNTVTYIVSGFKQSDTVVEEEIQIGTGG